MSTLVALAFEGRLGTWPYTGLLATVVGTVAHAEPRGLEVVMDPTPYRTEAASPNPVPYAELSQAFWLLPPRPEGSHKPSDQATSKLCTPEKDTLGDAFPVHTRERVTKGLPIKIVAIGSSSTLGVGASSGSTTFPRRLEEELKAKLPGLPITVLNKGVNGEEARQMVARFDADVIEENPDLVLWQLGSNAAFGYRRNEPSIVHDGVKRLRANGAEVILIDPQYAPATLESPDTERIIDQIQATALDLGVGHFRRFNIMKQWHESIPFESFISSDGVHQNDWSYGCLARLLAESIVDGARLPVATAVLLPSTRARR